MHYMRKSNAKKGTIVFKIDLKKMHDKLDWKLLYPTLVDFGFFSCYYKVDYVLSLLPFSQFSFVPTNGLHLLIFGFCV